MNSAKIFTAVVVLFVFPISWAEFAYTEQCPPSNVAGFSGTDDVIWVYVEVDFDDELSACNNKNIPPYTDDDSGFYSSHIRNIVMKSMNVWNTQARGPELRFGGWVSSLYDTPEEACDNSMFNRPAVFVNYNPSCKPSSTEADGCSSAIATVGSISQCSDAVHLTFWGNNDGTFEPAGTTCSSYLSCAYDSDCDDANCNDGECLCSDVPATSGECEIFGGTCTKDSECPTYLYCYGDNNQCRCMQNGEYCESDKGVNWLTNSQRSDPRDPAHNPQYSLYGVLNHELGHVLGVGHAIDTSQSPLPEGAAMRGGGSPLCSVDADCDDTGCRNDGDDQECTCTAPNQVCSGVAGEPSCTKDADCLVPCQNDPGCTFTWCVPLDGDDNWLDQRCELVMSGNAWMLWKWDRECAHVNSKNRVMKYAKVTWPQLSVHNDSSEIGPSPVDSSISTQFGTHGPGAWTIPSGYFKYPLMQMILNDSTPHFSMASVGWDGALNFAGSSLNSYFHYPFSSASVHALSGISGSAAQTVYQNPGPVIGEAVPPRMDVSNYDGSGWSGAWLHECTNSSCTTTEGIRSTQPITTVYDPATGLDVSAYVDLDGDIRIVAGYDNPWEVSLQGSNTTSRTSRLKSLGALPSAPSHQSTWEHEGKTDGPPGLACADPSFGLYNCLIVWTDYGVPGGDILYAYFRIGSGNHVYWHYTTGVGYQAFEMPNAAGVTGVTAAFFNNAFHLAWRRASAPTVVRYKFNTGGYQWNTNYENFNATDIVGTPTFMALDGRESALVWTTN